VIIFKKGAKSKRKSGIFSDLVNTVLFVIALALLLGLLSALDPTVKRWFARLLQ